MTDTTQEEATDYYSGMRTEHCLPEKPGSEAFFNNYGFWYPNGHQGY